MFWVLDKSKRPANQISPDQHLRAPQQPRWSVLDISVESPARLQYTSYCSSTKQLVAFTRDTVTTDWRIRMDGGTAVARVLTVGERSYKKEIEKLLLGDGETFHGEGILAITKALLQSGIS